MSVTTEFKYGAYSTVVPPYLNDKGAFEDKYGVIVDPQTNSFLLCENTSFLTQENGGKIELG
jgi:hypothetical protein